VKKQQLNPEGIPIFGSIISFELESVNARDQFLSKIKLFTLAESLGGVESLVCIPYEMTHGSVPPVMKKKMGLSKKLIRLSVGIEHVDDLYDDITQSLFH
jgi:cystathionine beta-lyase/cystathionine gamma-synthase